MDKVVHFEIPRAIREKVDIGDMGYSAYFKDSEGNVHGLWGNK